jgi:CBS domain-containing protein
MNVAQIMTRDVIAVAPGAKIAEIAALLVQKNISAVLVTDAGGRLVGMVSEGDLMRRPEIGTQRETSWWLRTFSQPETVAEFYLKSRGLTAADVMTRDLVTVTEDTTLAEAAERMVSFRVKRLPVLREDAVVGVVSRADLVRAVAAAESPRIEDREDSAIRRMLEGALIREDWFGDQNVSITVADRVVHLWGIARSAKTLRAIALAARGVPGVRDVIVHASTRRPEPEAAPPL